MNPLKRCSDDEAVEDSKPYLVNLSTDSMVKQEKIIIHNDEFSVGRCLDASLNIPDVILSRKHCILKKEVIENSESSWFLQQLGSSLSWVNAKRVLVNEKVALKTGDLIEFGELRAYSFKFLVPDLESDCKRTRQMIKEEQGRKEENLSMKLIASELEQEKMMKEKAELELQMQEKIRLLEERYQKEKEELEKKIQDENLEKQKLAEERTLIEEKLAQEKLLAEQKFNDEKVLLEDKLKGLEETVKQIEEEKISKEQERKLLEEEAEKIKATLAEKEAALKETTEQLKKDGEYEENIKKMNEELEKVKEDLVQNMSKQSLLEKQLKDTAGSSYLAAKTELLESFGEVIESELQCSICSELYVEATTLNCMHTFCKYCLNKWKKRKKECPVCRAKIKTENRAFIWDSFIEKMVEKLSDDLRQRRKALIAERAGRRSSTTNPANPAMVPQLITSASFQVANTNGVPRFINAQTIRIAVPVSNTNVINVANIRGVQPNIRAPYIPSVRLLGSIDLTQGRNRNIRPNVGTPRPNTHNTPGRYTPNVINPNRTTSSSASSSSGSSSRSRRSARLKAKRRRVPRFEQSERTEVINLDYPSTSASSTPRPQPVIEDAVIEITDGPSSPTPTAPNATNNSDSDSDDNIIVVPIRRKINNPPVINPIENNSPQPSTSGSNSTSEPSTSSASSTSRPNPSKRKRAADSTIVLSSSDSDSNSDSNSSVEEHFDYAYTGGRCWYCGKKGHWARSCPNNS